MKKMPYRLASGLIFILFLDVGLTFFFFAGINPFSPNIWNYLTFIGLIVSLIIGRFLSKGYDPKDNDDIHVYLFCIPLIVYTVVLVCRITS